MLKVLLILLLLAGSAQALSVGDAIVIQGVLCIKENAAREVYKLAIAHRDQEAFKYIADSPDCDIGQFPAVIDKELLHGSEWSLWRVILRNGDVGWTIGKPNGAPQKDAGG